ncbi:MAG: condensation domain-containing protein, partial [Archangium sp.]
ELYIGGENLGRGYLERRELTAERFIPNPFEENGARMYRTGDVVRYLPDGNIEFRGRSDAQVKIRGFRIELGEIEVVMGSHPAVKEVVVVVREDVPGNKRLVAYWVAQEGQAPEANELREHLKQKLPGHMVPSAFVQLEKVPLTPNGKVDRKALPAPEVEESEELVAPRTEVERVVADIWAPLLGVARVGVHDNFFEMGGHSLLATQVVSRLREALGVEVPVRVLFEAPTVEQLAQRLEVVRGGKQGPRAPALVPGPREGEPPLSFAQQRLWFIEQLAPGSYSYNVPFFAKLKGTLEVGALERSLSEVVRRHEVLRTTFTQVNEQSVQRIAPELELALPVESLEAVAEAERARAVKRRAVEEFQRPFNLEKGPLVRAKLLRLAADEHVLLLVMHHIVCDGWSMGVLVRELSELYPAYARGEALTLPALPVQYADYAQWQREWLKGEVLEEQLAWWKQRLAGAPPVLELPTDRPRPPVRSSRGAVLQTQLPAWLGGAVRALSH